MRSKVQLLLVALLMMSCSKETMSPERGIDYLYGRELTHDRIVLGNRLENPYKTQNITKALASLYPTKADRVPVSKAPPKLVGVGGLYSLHNFTSAAFSAASMAYMLSSGGAIRYASDTSIRREVPRYVSCEKKLIDT